MQRITSLKKFYERLAQIKPQFGWCIGTETYGNTQYKVIRCYDLVGDEKKGKTACYCPVTAVFCSIFGREGFYSDAPYDTGDALKLGQEIGLKTPTIQKIIRAADNQGKHDPKCLPIRRKMLKILGFPSDVH